MDVKILTVVLGMVALGKNMKGRHSLTYGSKSCFFLKQLFTTIDMMYSTCKHSLALSFVHGAAKKTLGEAFCITLAPTCVYDTELTSLVHVSAKLWSVSSLKVGMIVNGSRYAVHSVLKMETGLF